MLTDGLHFFLKNSITWGVVALILAALAISGRFSVSLSNILFVLAFLIGCFGISRAGISIHFIIISCLLLGILLTSLSWWISPNHQKSRIDEANKAALAFTIADCTFDIVLEISTEDLNILQSSRNGLKNGNLHASIDIFEKDKPGKFIQMTIMGEWHGTEGKLYSSSLDNLTMFSLNDRRFMFFNKKPFIGNAQSGMTHLFSNKKYLLNIRGVITANKKIIILNPVSAVIRTHEGIVFPTTEFKRLDGTSSEYWQAETPSVPVAP